MNRVKQFYKSLLLGLSAGCALIAATAVQAQTSPVVATGDDFTLVVDSSGNLYAFGANGSGQLGVLDAGGSSPAALLVEPAGAWSTVAVSRGGSETHVLAIRTDGTLWAWGGNDRGQLGTGTDETGATESSSIPVQVGAASNWVQIACGSNYSYAINSDNELYGWGDNSRGQLLVLPDPFAEGEARSGIGTQVAGENMAPEPMRLLEDEEDSIVTDNDYYLSVAAGKYNALAVRADGALVAWGFSSTSQLGFAPQQSVVWKPEQIGSSLGWTRVFSGTELCFALRGGISAGVPYTGKLYSWGYGDKQSGRGDNQKSPTAVGNDLDWADVSIGENHALGLKEDGSLWGWGQNLDAQLGELIPDGSGGYISANTRWDAPRRIGDYLTYSAIGAGDRFSVAFAGNGQLTSFGINTDGQRGIGTNFGVDLQVIASGIAVTAQSGTEVTLEVTVSNEGVGDLPASSTVPLRFIIATEDAFDSISILDLVTTSGTAPTLTGGLASGDSTTVSFTFAVPDSLGIGAYYVAVIVDEANTILETDKTNNAAFIASPTVTVSGLSINEALDNFDLTFTLDGDADWYGWSSGALSDAEDGDAAISPTITGLGSAAIETVLSQPSILRFNWRSLSDNDSNNLKFQILGASTVGADVEISGQSDWEEVVLAVPAGITLQWLFTKGVESDSDKAYLDNIRIEPMSGPDFVVDSISLKQGNTLVESVSLVAGPGQDQLSYSLQIRNQGEAHPAGTPFKISVYLSRDANFNPSVDELVDEVNYSGPFAQNLRLPLSRSRELSDDLSGNYYIIAVADVDNDVAEIGVAGAFPDGAGLNVQSNNIFISESPSVQVQALPDLRVKPALGPSAESVTVSSSSGASNVFSTDDILFVAYEIENDGLGDALGGMQITIFLSEDETFDASEDYILFTDFFFGSISAGDSLANMSWVESILPSVPVADFRFIGVYIDSSDGLAETDDTNNIAYTLNPAYAFTEGEIDDAVEFDVSVGDSFPFLTGYPFFNQSTESFDGVDAAQSAVLDDGQFASMSAEVAVASDSILSFYWKVSSESSMTDGIPKRDALKLYIDDVQRASIAGEVDWTRQTVLLPASGTPYQLRWSYEKDGSTSEGQDLAWVDQIAVEIVTEPDFEFSGVQLVDGEGAEVDAVSLILGQSPLEMNYTITNGGATHAGASDITVSFYLSLDETLDVSDYAVDGLTGEIFAYVGALASGGQFSDSPSIDLDTAIPAGDYYLIGVIDSGDSIVEFDETNNSFVSETRSVQVLALPDLTIEFQDPDFGGLFLIDDALDLALLVGNAGLGPVEASYGINLVLSADDTVDNGDQLLREYTQNTDLPQGGAPYLFDPTIAEIGESVTVGEFVYLAALIDPDEAFAESDETNNIAIQGSANLVFAEVEFTEAVDWNGVDPLINDESYPFEADLPFIGLAEASPYSDDVARSVKVGDDQTSGFLLDVDLAEAAALSFAWKVSSERVENPDATVKADWLSVYVDGTLFAQISGEQDWSEEVIQLSAGPHSIRWAYEKDSDSSAGDDAGWVDAIGFLPDLQLTEFAVSSTASSPYKPGDPIDIEFKVANLGLGDLAAGAIYDVELRLSPDAQWGNDTDGNDITLSYSPAFDGSAGIVAGGETALLSFSTTIPEETPTESFYVLARVDPDPANDDVATNGVGLVPEQVETNNTVATATALFNVESLSIPEALEISGFDSNPPYQEVFPELANGQTVVQTGDSNWFAAADVTAVDNDSMKSPVLSAGESASLLFRFDVPRVVSFRWKAETQSSQNALFFGANGVPLRPEGNSVSAVAAGAMDWQQVHFIAPADAPVGFTYIQSLSPVGDERVYVDELVVGLTNVDKPDFVVDSIEFEAGEYVLERDRLFIKVKGSNRGADAIASLPEDFKVEVWLSADANYDVNDTSLGFLEEFQDLDAGTAFVYQSSLILPTELPEGNYYIIARVDSDNQVDEFAIDPATGGVIPEPLAFTEADNNFLFSSGPDIVIDRRADLRVLEPEDASNTEVDLGGPAAQIGENDTLQIVDMFIIEPTEAEGPSELQIRFDVINEGLQGISDAFNVSIYAATTRDALPRAENLITSFSETRGLAAGVRIPYEVTTSIPDNIEAGQFYYLNIVVDPADDIPESDEDDNSTFSPHRDVFVGDVSLDVAMNDQLPGAYTPSWTYSFVTPDETSSDLQAPFYGTLDDYGQDNSETGVRASAHSGPVPIGGSSWMQTSGLVVSDKQLISFRWKVSSQFTVTETGVLEDILEFSIREEFDTEFTQVAKISGEQDWAEFTYIIQEPGNYTLRWSYIENGDGERSGDDAGWVDDFSAVAFDFLPVAASSGNTIQPGLDVTVAGPLAPGDSFDLEFELINSGDRSDPAEGVLTQVRLTPVQGTVDNLDWSSANAGDIILLNQRLPIGTFAQTIVIPSDLSVSGDYYVGVWVDPQAEFYESSTLNNLAWSDGALIELVAPQSIFGALDTGAEPQLDGNDDWVLSGEGRWFPVMEATSVNGWALKNPEQTIAAGESASFAATIEGPKLLSFRWKSDLGSSTNYAGFALNGVPQTRESILANASLMQISGASENGTNPVFDPIADPDGWITEQILIPAGLQEISWTYFSNDSGSQGDVWVDSVVLQDVTQADLAITDVSYTGGDYVLERDQFPVDIVVENRGSLPVGFDYNDLDLELRLSEGNDFDTAPEVIGNLSVQDVLESGQRMVFSGNIDLPVDLEPKAYYLLARIKSLDPTFTEFTYDTTVELTENNDFVSVLQDVRIVRLPQLVVTTSSVENEKLFYPKETIRFDWELENVGLGDVPAGTELTQTIELWAFPPDTESYVISEAEYLLDVDSVTETAYIPGRLSAANPLQSVVQYSQTYKLPRQAVLLAALGAPDVEAEMEDLDDAVIEALGEFEGYEFFFVLKRDTEIEQSSELNFTAVTDERFMISAFPFDGEDPALDAVADVSYDSWQSFISARLGGVLPSSDLHADFPGSGFENIYYYALNLPLVADLSETSPSLTDTGGTTAYTKTRTIEDDGSTYRALTFPIVRGATDLVYRIQNSDDGGSTWNTLLDIEPPYLDTLYGRTAGYSGNDTLSGPSGLIAESNLIFSVVDNNYTATVTVRNDTTDTDDMRLIVYVQDRSLADQFVIDYFEGIEEYDYTLNRPEDDYDGDTVSNIVELQLGSDPADIGSIPTATEIELFVAEGMADAGVFGVPAPSNIGPLDNYDSDAVNNALELMAGSDPTDNTDVVAVDTVEYFVADVLLGLNAFDTASVENYGPDEDFDADGVSNIVEIVLGRDPTDGGDAGSTTDLENFVAQEFVDRSEFADPLADIGPSDDFDSDGTNNITELQVGRDPTSIFDAGTTSPLVNYTAFGMAQAGIYGDPLPGDIGPEDNYDSDLLSNVIELMLGSDPSDNMSGVLMNTMEYYVANELLTLGAFDDAPVEEFAPLDDFDNNGFSNISELQLDLDPTDPASKPASELEGFVAEQIALLGIFGTPSDSFYQPSFDLDNDGASNIAELQLGRNPVNNGDADTTSALEDYVAEQLANLEVFGSPAPTDIGPEDDYDSDGDSNIAELQFGSDPTDSGDQVAESESAVFVAEQLAKLGVIVGVGGVISADIEPEADLDGDTESNLLEIALGGDPTDIGVMAVALQSSMSPPDHIVTYTRLKTAVQPADLTIVAECTDDMTNGPWNPINLPVAGASESVTDLGDDYEEVELTIDTGIIDCPFVRVTVSVTP